MLRFAANLCLLFSELPLVDRFQAARQCGFSAVEIQFPYELPAEQIRSLLDQHGLRLVLFNVDADTLLRGGEGLAAVPEKRLQFQAAVGQAAAYAEILHPNFINVLPGRCLDHRRIGEYRNTFLENLRYAATAFARLGIGTVFEAINTHDMPGFIVSSSEEMLKILREVDHPDLRLQYDIYHMSRMGENCLTFFQRHMDKIGHIQFADCPGRGQPGSGSLDIATLFNRIEASGYSGWIGAEYRPTDTTVGSLDWFKPYSGNQSRSV